MSPQVTLQLEPTGPFRARVAPAAAEASIELYWLPLGAGGWFVRLNGRIWEAIHARRERRRPSDLYHTALVVRVPEGRFVVENCWPIPDANGSSRGVAVEGPVGSRRLGRWRVFRYEVRRPWAPASQGRGPTLSGAGLALGAAIGLILGVLAGGGVAIAFGVAGGATLDCSWGRPLSATGRHHQVATQLTATSALVTLARVEQWPPATLA